MGLRWGKMRYTFSTRFGYLYSGERKDEYSFSIFKCTMKRYWKRSLPGVKWNARNITDTPNDRGMNRWKIHRLRVPTDRGYKASYGIT